MAKKKRTKIQPQIIHLGDAVAVGVSNKETATCSTFKTEVVRFSIDNAVNGDGMPAEWARTFPFRKNYRGEAPASLTINVQKLLPNWDGRNWCALRHLLELGGVDYRQVRGWSLWDVCMRLQLNPPYRQTCNMVELSDLAAERRKRMKLIKQQATERADQ